MDIYDGKDGVSPIIVKRLCGSNIPTSIFSTENELFIRISSDTNLKKAGFKLKFEERGKLSPLQLEKNDHVESPDRYCKL